MDFRVEERDWWHLEHLWRQENRKWRKEDIEQRVLENARWIWLRYAEKNRRDVEEKSEQLKSISNLSALIAGFAVVAFVELQFHDPETKPTHVGEVLIVAYAATTATVVALMLNSMVLCSFLLCSILRNGKTYVSEAEEADYLFRCRSFSANYKPGDAPPTPKRSFEAFWETRCEDDWKHAFRMFTCGVPVFLVNIACVAWLKFHYSPAAAGATTAVAVVATAGWAKTQNNWGWHVAARRGAAGAPPWLGAPRARACLRLARQAERAPGIRARRVQERRRRDRRRRRHASLWRWGGRTGGRGGGCRGPRRDARRGRRRERERRRRRRGDPRGGGSW